MAWRCLAPLLLSGLLSLAIAAPPSPPGAPLNTDEQTLRDAGLRTDPDALLSLLRSTTEDCTPERLREFVQQLGDESFEVRRTAAERLTALRGRAVPALRAAREDADPEVRRLADDCLRRIRDSVHPEWIVPAARLIAQRRPRGAVPVLLDALPALGGHEVTDALHEALAALATTDGRPDPALVTALADPDPERRAGAGAALGRAGAALPEVRRLLDDRDPTVRRAVGLALAERGEREAVPALISLLDELTPNRLWKVEDILYTLARESAPPTPPGQAPAERRAYRAAWAGWWSAHGATLDMARLRPAPYLDRTLVLLLDDGKAVELDANDQPLWELGDLDKPLDVQYLPGERLLVAENGRNRVVERHRSGAVLWEQAIGSPIVAQRLPDGHTFIASQTELREVDREGTVLFTYARTGWEFYRARRLPNGEIACVLGRPRAGEGRFLRFRLPDKVLSEFPVRVGTYGGRIEVLPNGHVLVPEHFNDRVVEYDGQGNVKGQFFVRRPIVALRLSNGNTLVTLMEDNRAVEFDAAGKIIWAYQAARRVNRVLRR